MERGWLADWGNWSDRWDDESLADPDFPDREDDSA